LKALETLEPRQGRVHPSNVTRLCAEAAEGVERDLISIATLVEPGD
jgi:hypothetical protein